MQRVLITGAGGGIGRSLRETLSGVYPVLRLSDRVALAPARDGEEIDRTEISDMAAVERMVEGVDGIIHLGGNSGENTWDVILQSNIIGVYNVFEAARRAGVQRVVMATSNHAVGFYPRTQTIDHRGVAAAGQSLRPQQGVFRGARQPLRRQARDRLFVRADRQFRHAADRQKAVINLDQPARSDPACAYWPRTSRCSV